jgi:hypothetical protein
MRDVIASLTILFLKTAVVTLLAFCILRGCAEIWTERAEMIERIKVGDAVYEVDNHELINALKECETERQAEKVMKKAEREGKK